MDADAYFYSFSALGSNAGFIMSVLNLGERSSGDTELMNAAF